MEKRGRPKADVIKERIVTIRMSEEEYHALKEYSAKHQQTKMPRGECPWKREDVPKRM